MAFLGGMLGFWVAAGAAEAAGLSGGLKFGINTAFIRGADASKFPYYDHDWLLRFGLCGGGLVTLDLSKSVSLQAEALLSRKGSSELGQLFDYPTYRYSIVIDYLEVPILIRLVTSLRSKSKFFLQAGPAVGFKLSGKLIRSGEPLPLDGLRPTDTGIVFGIGRIQRSGFLAEIRCTMGLSRIAKVNGAPLDVKNGVLSVKGGYIF